MPSPPKPFPQRAHNTPDVLRKKCVDRLSMRQRMMAQVYFHYSNADGALVDRRGTVLDNLADLNDCAMGVVQSLISVPSAEDWRQWVLHVSDDQGEELFVLPFTKLLGKPN
jgi:hypothetical protein